jgi:ankyrin repeat protein
LLVVILLSLLLPLLLQAHHLLNNGALVNQADGRGWTPLHRAAHLAHLEGYLEIYEYLLV